MIKPLEKDDIQEILDDFLSELEDCGYVEFYSTMQRNEITYKMIPKIIDKFFKEKEINEN